MQSSQKLHQARRRVPRRAYAAFSLLELLVGCAVFVLLLALTLSIISQISDVWRLSTNKITAFQGARVAFERITRDISQATLNTYYDYYDAGWNRRTQANKSTFVPNHYGRHSELHFRAGNGLLGTPTHSVFFQAPVSRTANRASYGGLDNLLNACGFFIDYVEDDIPKPYQSRIATKSRYRLMQWVQNTEALAIYNPASASDDAWFQDARDEAVPLADNVIALVIWPRLSEGDARPSGWTDSYEYDSKAKTTGSQPVKQHQLPPIVQVALVAIDGRSAERLGNDLKTQIDASLNGLFQSLDNADPAGTLQRDLDTLETRLQAKKIDYRIFESSVPLREAKWSKQ